MKVQPNRDDTRDLVIATKTALDVHTETDEQHFEETNKKFDKIELNFKNLDAKIDKLGRNQIFAAGALAAVIILMNYPQLIRSIQPTNAEASAVHVERHHAF